MQKSKLYSIVVPCYKSGLWTDELVLRITTAMKNAGAECEILLVNDCSPDTVTWPAICSAARKYEHVRGIDMLYNVGQFRATLCGLDQANGDYCITLDDDLQHLPEELPKLLKAMDENPEMDCIMGAFDSKKHSLLRNIGSRFMQKISGILYGKRQDVTTTSFRIMPSSFAKTLVLYRTATPHLGPLIVSLSQNIMNIPVEHAERKYGRSGYTLARCIRETWQCIINASIFPLRMLSALGGFFSLVAFFIAITYFLRFLVYGTSVPGYTSLILVISFFSGLILLGVGILGEYVGRLIREVTGLPPFRIKSDTAECKEAKR